MPLASPLAPADCRNAALAVHCRHRRGRRRWLEPGRARADRGGRHRVRRPAASGAGGVADPRRRAAMAEPVRSAVAEVMEQRGRQVCVLASGDPFFHGVGALLARHVDPAEMLVRAGAVIVQSRRRAARLVAARHRAGLAARPLARSDPPASASGRANSGADLRTARGRGAWQRCSPTAGSADAADRAGGARRAARAGAKRTRRGFRPCRCCRAQRRRA